MTHTPGPWKVADQFYILMDDDVACEVAKVCDENIDDDMVGQCDADARLIAAAPEILAALRNCRDWLVCITGHANLEDTERGYLEAATAAIAKAEGRGE